MGGGAWYVFSLHKISTLESKLPATSFLGLYMGDLAPTSPRHPESRLRPCNEAGRARTRAEREWDTSHC